MNHFKVASKPGTMAHIFNPSTRDVKAGVSLSLRLGCLEIEFQHSQDYMEKPCIEKPICILISLTSLCMNCQC